MRRLCLLACALFLLSRAGEPGGWPEEPFRPKGLHNNSVHRYFPDLDSRLNAVRYGRWRALEIAWLSGIDRRLDRQFSSYLLALLADPPRYAPEADRVAPSLSREAGPVFRALRWGQMLEQQLSDALASPDASASLTEARLEKALDIYRRERHALSEPEDPGASRDGGEAARAAPVSTKILVSGTALFARTAEDLAASDFGEQRWRVRKTIDAFDRSFAGDFARPAGSAEPETESPGAVRLATYASLAPTVAADYPRIAEQLDRLVRFRTEVFEALIPGGETAAARRERDARLATVARRYGLPPEGIRAR